MFAILSFKTEAVFLKCMFIACLFLEVIRERLYDSARYEFADCLFIDCRNPSLKGGGLYFEINENVTLSESTFKNCIGLIGGGAYISSYGFRVKNMVFDNCNVSSEYNAFLFNSNYVESPVSVIQIKDCMTTQGSYTIHVGTGVSSGFRCMNSTNTLSGFEEFIFYGNANTTVRYINIFNSTNYNGLGGDIYFWGGSHCTLSYTNVINTKALGIYGLCVIYDPVLRVDHFAEVDCEYDQVFVVFRSGSYIIEDAIISNHSKIRVTGIESLRSSGTPYPFEDTDCPFMHGSSRFTANRDELRASILMLVLFCLLQ